MTNPQEMPDHISNETLAAFADGRLSGAERQAVIEHLAGCDECRDDLQAIGEAQDLGVVGGGGEVVTGNFVRRALIGMVAAVAAVAIVFVPPVREKIDSYRTGGVSELVEASESLDERPIQARVSGGFSHKKFSVNRSGNGPDLSYALQAAALRVVEDGSARGAGIAHLLVGDRDEAVSALERAVASRPNDALVLSDCAAAHLERSRFGGDEPRRVRDVQRAIELTDRAWTMKKTPEIAWNRALARELSERPDAGQAWQDYLQLDPDSAWADEVNNAHLER